MKSEKRVREISINCQHVEGKANIYYEMVIPAEILPESLPRIMNRRCMQMEDCHLWDKTACPAGIQPQTQVH